MRAVKGFSRDNVRFFMDALEGVFGRLTDKGLPADVGAALFAVETLEARWARSTNALYLTAVGAHIAGRKTLVSLAVACAREVLPLVPHGERRVLDAFDYLEAWAASEAATDALVRRRMKGGARDPAYNVYCTVDTVTDALAVDDARGAGASVSFAAEAIAYGVFCALPARVDNGSPSAPKLLGGAARAAASEGRFDRHAVREGETFAQRKRAQLERIASLVRDRLSCPTVAELLAPSAASGT